MCAHSIVISFGEGVPEMKAVWPGIESVIWNHKQSLRDVRVWKLRGSRGGDCGACAHDWRPGVHDSLVPPYPCNHTHSLSDLYTGGQVGAVRRDGYLPR